MRRRQVGGSAAGEQEKRSGGPACDGASRRSPWGDRRMWHVGKEKEGDDMWEPHVSEWRGGQGRMGTPASGPNMVLDVHNSVFPTAGEL